MHYKELFREENEQMIERFTLSIRRIREIREEGNGFLPYIGNIFVKWQIFFLRWQTYMN